MLIKRQLIIFTLLFTLIFALGSCSSSDDSGSDDDFTPTDEVGEISGMVTDQDGNVYERVRVHLKEGTSTFRTVNTDENGNYLFTNVPVGTFNISIDLPLSTDHAGTDPKQVTVQENGNSTVDFGIETNFIEGVLVLGSADFLGEVRNASGNIPTGPTELLFAVNVFSNQEMVPILGPDGSQITLDQWDNAGGTAEIFCDGETTHLSFTFTGLLPEGAYTLWVGPMENTDILGTGALGDSSGTENVLEVDQNGNAEISITMTPGSLSVFGFISSCLLTNQTDILLILDYHIDGQTHGGSPGADSTEVGHMLFVL